MNGLVSVCVNIRKEEGKKKMNGNCVDERFGNSYPNER